MKCLRRLATLSCVIVALASLGFPQTSSTSLQGEITDPSGSAVPGATVVLANAESKVERTVVTGTQGEYRILALPPGTYTLSVTAKGFAEYRQTGLQLLVNTPATANVQLKIGTASEVITVASEAPALNLVDASLGNSFGETQVRQIPLEGRNVPDLLSLQAGVAYTGNRPDIDKDQDSRNGSVNGARSDQSNITLDGVDVNDQSSGYAFTSVLPVTLDSVQEFRVTTSNYNADQGQGSRAQVSLVTKSGTNNWHGSLYEYHSNTLTSANDYFVKQAELSSSATATEKPVPYATGAGKGFIAAGDFNRDGKLDLAVTVGTGVSTLLGNGDGSFQPPVQYATAGASGGVFAADLNGDDVLDLVVLNNSVPKISILLGNGDGTFQPHVDYPAGAEAFRGGVADVNGDSKLDVVMTAWYTSNDQYFVLLGNGDGTFQKPRVYSAGTCPLGTAFGDFNNDGILDLAIADQCGPEISVMLGTVVELQLDTLAFGAVSVGENSSLTTQLTNIRKSALEITNITVSNGAFSQTNNCGRSVGAGQSCTITVTFAPPKTGWFEATVAVKDTAPRSPQRVFLSGRGSAVSAERK